MGCPIKLNASVGEGVAENLLLKVGHLFCKNKILFQSVKCDRLQRSNFFFVKMKSDPKV